MRVVCVVCVCVCVCVYVRVCVSPPLKQMLFSVNLGIDPFKGDEDPSVTAYLTPQALITFHKS